jgi:hypothetical protein
MNFMESVLDELRAGCRLGGLPAVWKSDIEDESKAAGIDDPQLGRCRGADFRSDACQITDLSSG